MGQQNIAVNKMLTSIVEARKVSGYIADSVLPMLKSPQLQGKIGALGNNHMRIETSIIGGSGQYREVTPLARSTKNFNIVGHGLKTLVTLEDEANAGSPFNAEKEAVMLLDTKLRLEQEKVLADALGDTAIITQNVTLSGTDQFNDYTNSKPIEKITTGIASVKTGCGMLPNTIITSWEVVNKLRYHPELLDKLGFKYDKAGGLSYADIAAAFGLSKILVGEVQYNTAKEGQTDAFAPVWGKNLVLAYITDEAQSYNMSLGYTMRYEKLLGPKVYTSPGENPNSTRVFENNYYDQYLSNVNCAYLIKDAIA